jgi:hypothetical protein
MTCEVSGTKWLWAYFTILFQHLPGGTEENHNKPVRIVYFWSKVRAQDTPYMKQECQLLHSDIEWEELYANLRLDTVRFIVLNSR